MEMTGIDLQMCCDNFHLGPSLFVAQTFSHEGACTCVTGELRGEQ